MKNHLKAGLPAKTKTLPKILSTGQGKIDIYLAQVLIRLFYIPLSWEKMRGEFLWFQAALCIKKIGIFY
jgi:hypothetical protein